MRSLWLMAHNNQMEGIIQQIQAFLNEGHTEREIIDFINNFQSKSVKPTLKLHQINLEALTQPTFVYAHLMVQDVRDPYYYYSFAIKKDYTSSDPFYLFKYGNILNNDPESIEDNKEKFIYAMTDQNSVVCMPVRYQTKWANQLEGSIYKQKQLIMEVDGRADYKLGQVINVVALYNPKFNKLFMVREMSKEEAIKEGLEIVSELVNNQVDCQKARQQLMNIFGEFASQIFSQYLLMTLISEQSLFLGCQSNITELIEQIYPRVAHIKLVHPCNQSLFPFKNEDGQLQITPMQMSSLPTFVVLDLSQFSPKQSVVIKGGEIQNFSALKMFVEEGKTIYRWEMGESQVQHHHKGLIVKGSKLITPHFNPKEQKISPDFSNLKKITENSKIQVRKYLQRVLQIDPKLEEPERKLIEKDLAVENMKQKIGSSLADIMKISKLLAKSHGRSSILFSDFQRAKELIDYNQPSK